MEKPNNSSREGEYHSRELLDFGPPPREFACLRTFAPKSSHAQIFFKLATQKGHDILLPKRQKKIGGHRLRFGENMPRKIP